MKQTFSFHCSVIKETIELSNVVPQDFLYVYIITRPSISNEQHKNKQK